MSSRARAVYDMVLQDKSAVGRRAFLGSLDTIDSRAAALAVGGVAALGVAGAAAFTAIYNTQAPIIDALGKLSESTDIGVEKLQAMQDAAERAGVPLDALNGSLLEGLKRISESAGGAGEAGKILAELGLDAETLRQQAPEDQIMDILSALEDVSNVGDRIKFADKLFGGQGVSLIRLTTGAINEAEQEMRDLDLALNEINVANVEALNDQLQLIGRYTGQSSKIFTAEMAPAISAVIDGVSGLGNGLAGVRGTTQLVAEVLAGTAGIFLDSFQGWRIIITGIELGFQKAALAAAELYAKFDDSATAYFKVYELSESVRELSNDIETLSTYKPSDAIEASLEARRAESQVVQSELDETIAALRKAEEERREAAANRETVKSGSSNSSESAGDDIEADIRKQLEREDELAKQRDDRAIESIQRDIDRRREYALTEEQLLLEEQERTAAILDGIAARDISRADEVNAAKEAANQQYHDEYLQLLKDRQAETDKREKAQMDAGRSYLEQGIAHFAQKSEAADVLHKALVARRMFREGREAVIGAYKWGASIAGPAGGAVAAAVAGAYTAALIAETVGGGQSTTTATSTVDLEETTDNSLSDSASSAAQTTSQQQVVYNAYFPATAAADREAVARQQLADDIAAKRIVIGDNVDVQVNVFDYEDYGT